MFGKFIEFCDLMKIIICFYMLINYSSTTEIKRSFEIKCKLDSECGRNAYCERLDFQSGGTCKCVQNYILQINWKNQSMDCLPRPEKFGDSCEKDIQCQIIFGSKSVCLESHCVCEENAHFENGLCFHSGKIGDQCDTNEECYIKDTLTFCLHSVCVCNTFYHPIENGTKCVKSKILGDKCDNDNECTVENSRCYGECRCLIHYVGNHDRNRCLKANGNFNETCEEDVQCSAFIDNGACVNNMCNCAPDYHVYNSKCWKNVKIFEDCENTNECITSPELDGFVECSSERCICTYGINSNRTCIISKNKSNTANNYHFQTLYILLLLLITKFMD